MYLDEIAGEAVPITFRFTPGVGDVIDVELWTNVNRRDLANADKNADGYPDGVVPINGNTVTDSPADTDPVTGHYFAPLNMTDADGGVWGAGTTVVPCAGGHRPAPPLVPLGVNRPTVLTGWTDFPRADRRRCR